MPKLGAGFDKADYVGVISKVWVQPLDQYLRDKHGEDADDIIDKFNNVTRDNIIVVAGVEELKEDVEGFFSIPKASGWQNSNIRSFMAVNELPAVDPYDSDDLASWLGLGVKVVWESTSKGKFLRLAK